MASNSDHDDRLVFAEESLVVAAQGLLQELMDKNGMSRADLARAMGVSRARVTQLFSDECKNFTVRLLARAVFALGEEISLGYAGNEKIIEGEVSQLFDLPVDEYFPTVGHWDDKGDFEYAECWHSANDNLFDGLADIRDFNSRYRMVA